MQKPAEALDLCACVGMRQSDEQRILHMSYHYDPSGKQKSVIPALEKPKITIKVLARREQMNKILHEGHSTDSRGAGTVTCI